MEFSEQLGILDHVYRVYDEVVGDFENACGKGCDQCCTRNVTLTTLEASRILKRFEDIESLVSKAGAQKDRARMVPKVTTNLLVELCINGEDVPEEESEASWGSCPLLSDDQCPLYDQRPFACRCMTSTHKCSESGYAHMNEFMITMNNVFIQYIEHIDAAGYTANLTDMLLWFSGEEKMKAYEAGYLHAPEDSFIKNREMKMLMVPPEHREQMEPILARLFARQA